MHYTDIRATGTSIFALNCIGGVIVSALASSVFDRRFESESGQAKDYGIGLPLH